MNREIVLLVLGNSYSIKFPTVGQFQAIESLKQVISKGMYSSLMSTNTVSANASLDMIDIEAYLTVLCPQLLKDLKCDSFINLGVEDYMVIKEAYDKQFIPWWNDIMKLVSPMVKSK